MLRRKHTLVFAALIMLLGSLGVASPARADNDAPPPPEPIVVKTEVKSKVIGNVILPNSVFPGPGTEIVTITNRYYSYYGGKVKTDGKAEGNFNQPSGSRFVCQSHVYNKAQQHGTYETSYGSYGGTNCPYTAQAVLSGGVVPNTYYSWTKAWWKWSNNVNAYGKAEQSNYQP